jgi:replicative DNA helicase
MRIAKDLLREFEEQLQEMFSTKTNSGLKALDDILMWRAGTIHLFASTTGLGKTSIACQIVRETIKNKGIVVFCSLEMSSFEILERINLSNEEINNAQLYFSSGDCNIDTIEKEFESFVENNNKTIDLIVFDHVGSIQTDENDNATCSRRNNKIMKTIKDITTKTQASSLCLSQLDFKYKNKTIDLNALSYSSEFARYADSCTYMFENFSMQKSRVLTFPKNRNGNFKCEELILDFDEQNCVFSQLVFA